MKSSNRPVIIVRKRVVAAAGHHGGAWKVAYADFVTAMMAFFLLLWLLSSPEKDRLRGIARYFSPLPPSADVGSANGNRLIAATNRMSPQQPAGPPRRDSPADAIARTLSVDLKLALLATPQLRGLHDNVAIEQTRDGVRIQVMDTGNRPMFRESTAEMNGYGRILFAAIGRALGARGARIAVEGHTDSLGGAADINWRLSGDRAQAARQVMNGAGLAGDRIAEVVALGSTRPAFPDDPGRPENRRVTLVVLDEAPALPALLAAPPPPPDGPA